MTHTEKDRPRTGTVDRGHVLDLVAATLATAGWLECLGPSAAAAAWTKAFATAVGEKRANAYLSAGGAPGSNWALQGSYWSEGRDVLGASVVLIAATADDTQVQELAARFVKYSDRAISQSYAVRLLHAS